MTPMTEIEKLKDGVYEKVMSRRFAEVLKEALAEDQVRAGEQKRQSADLIFLFLLESVLAARECIEIQSHKDAARKERSHAGFASTTNPRAKFSRTCTK